MFRRRWHKKPLQVHAGVEGEFKEAAQHLVPTLIAPPNFRSRIGVLRIIGRVVVNTSYFAKSVHKLLTNRYSAGTLYSGCYPSYHSMSRSRPDSLQSSLDLLVLKVLSRHAPIHGYGIAMHIQQASEDALRVEEGSLYPALHRMEEAGLVKAGWTTTENKRRARVYELTHHGRERLAAEQDRWSNFSAAVNRVLRFV
jgi:PadR family transcriptional regulator, regulatory protein PadR